ncbi:MAG: hypothetical protein R3B90_17855 [Planctomycetaceae bacterium]
MSPILSALDQLRRRLRLVVVLRGLVWAAVVTLGGLILAAGIDAFWHVNSPWLRLSFTTTSVVAGLATLFYKVHRPLRAPWDDVAVALLVERLVPEWKDRLASAADFAGRVDPVAVAVVGFPNLGASHAGDAGLTRLVDTRAVWRAVAGLAVMLALLAGLVALAPGPASVAFARQWRPFSAPVWPRSVVLALLDADLQPLEQTRHVSAGEPMTVYVANLRGDLPPGLQLLRSDDGRTHRTQLLTPTSLSAGRGGERELAVATLTPKIGKVRLRAVGGDDREMPWTVIDVLPAPTLERFEIELTPPAYSRLPIVKETRGVGHLDALIGSTARLMVHSNVPLSRLTLHRDGAPAVELASTQGGLTFAAELSIDREGRGSYWFELTDEYAAASRSPEYELRGRRDEPPTIDLQSPPVSLTVTPHARLPLRGVATDDLGLAQVQLAYSSGLDTATPPTIESPLPLVTPADGSPIMSATIDQLWSIEKLRLVPGDRLHYWLQVDDGRTPEAQRTRSREQTLQVLDIEEKRREIQAHQAGMARLVERMILRQQQAQQQTSDLSTQFSHAGELRGEDIKSLDNLDLERRRLLGDLTDGRAGLAAQILRVRQELSWNQLSDDAIESRMDRLDLVLRRLVDELLPSLSERLTSLREQLRATAADAAIINALPESH